MTDAKKIKLTVRPSKADSRDFRYQQKRVRVENRIDLREWDSPVDNQGDLGSCVGLALSNAYELMIKNQYPDQYKDLSALFIYYHSRLFYNLMDEDAGAYLRDGLRALKNYGVCADEFWPYEIEKFDDQPTPEAYADAAQRAISKYETLYTLTDIIETLNDRVPVVIGADVYESFSYIDSYDPTVPIPGLYDYYIGGHAMVIVGYDLSEKKFLVKNSFGPDWGDNGYCWLWFEYVRQYAFEKWRFSIPDLTVPILKELVDLGKDQEQNQ